MAKKPPSDRFVQKRLWTDEIVIYSRLKETYHHTIITITTITILQAAEEVKTWSVPERALFFLIRYCRGLTDCSRTDPSGSRSIFLVPKHEKGPPLATRYIVVPIHISIPDTYIYIYLFLVHATTAITVLPNSRDYILYGIYPICV